LSVVLAIAGGIACLYFYHWLDARIAKTDFVRRNNPDAQPTAPALPPRPSAHNAVAVSTSAPVGPAAVPVGPASEPVSTDTVAVSSGR